MISHILNRAQLWTEWRSELRRSWGFDLYLVKKISSGFAFDGEHKWAALRFHSIHLLEVLLCPWVCPAQSMWLKHSTSWKNCNASAPELTFKEEETVLLTTNRWLFTFVLTAAFKTFPHHHEYVGKDDKREGDGQATAVLLDQEVTLELPHLVVVLLHWSNSVTDRQRRRKHRYH